MKTLPSSSDYFSRGRYSYTFLKSPLLDEICNPQYAAIRYFYKYSTSIFWCLETVVFKPPCFTSTANCYLNNFFFIFSYDILLFVLVVLFTFFIIFFVVIFLIFFLLLYLFFIFYFSFMFYDLIFCSIVFFSIFFVSNVLLLFHIFILLLILVHLLLALILPILRPFHIFPPLTFFFIFLHGLRTFSQLSFTWCHWNRG